ncbi:single-stranded DNA-binding protein [Massilia sp. CCM 8733]|uniref:Single-stranded DNA-binding protein n=1 Tax=Massilia mucilaginosa TaxID=2609282 RepID=A0ABX0P672_9BURK|nr:single-stranded DNA-binding protein [Massilia mucilaginosa]NHZ93927.1 single-stranded DNA-binding protein [Massilia mucilaginosa]
MKMEDKKSQLAVKAMVVMVVGRLEGSKSYEGKRYTQVMTPAADAYSRPQLVEIRSKGRLGEKGDEISCHCVLGGFQRKAYETKDKQTGEIVKVVPVEHTLDLCEE